VVLEGGARGRRRAERRVTRPFAGDLDFRRYWFARVVSVAGSAVTYIALPVLTYALTHSPVLTGVVTAAEGGAYLLLGLVAGSLADRLNRRWVMVASDATNAVVVGSIPVAAALHVLSLGQVIAVAAVSPAVFVFFDAANFAALPALVGSARVPAANAAVWGANTVAEILVPVLTGAALTAVAPSTLMALDALSFAASALLVRAIVRPLTTARPTSGTRMRADIVEGLRYLWRHPTVRPITLAGATNSVAGGAFVGQFVVFADRAFGVHRGDGRLGLLYTAWGVGELVASVLLPRVLHRTTAVRVMLVGLPASALLGIGTALAPTLWTALAGLVAWGAAYMLVVMNGITYRQQVTPDALQGRVNTTARLLGWGVGSPLGALAAGLLTNATTVRTALAVMAAVPLVGSLAAWLSPLPRVALAAADGG
jgi:MFS family permease